MMSIPTVENKLVLEVQDILISERLEMKMTYRNGNYTCTLRPTYRARVGVVIGRASTYSGAIDNALSRVDEFTI